MAMKHMTTVLTAILSASMYFAADDNPRRGRIRQAVVKQYDANGNGKLDNEERAQILKEHDANKNGRLDKDEQKDSPRKLVVVKTGHAPTKKPVRKAGHPVHDDVDASIRKAVSFRKSYTFEKDAGPGKGKKK